MRDLSDLLQTGDLTIDIDNEQYTIQKIHHGYNDDLLEIDCGSDGDFILSPSSELAGIAARQYWTDLAAYDPAEFRCIIGDDNLIRLALGQGASPGSAHVKTLDEWFDLSLDVPEEQWAGYDHEERTVTAAIHPSFVEEYFRPTVAYRSN